jgi:hypothetical protein
MENAPSEEDPGLQVRSLTTPAPVFFGGLDLETKCPQLLSYYALQIQKYYLVHACIVGRHITLSRLVSWHATAHHFQTALSERRQLLNQTSLQLPQSLTYLFSPVLTSESHVVFAPDFAGRHLAGWHLVCWSSGSVPGRPAQFWPHGQVCKRAEGELVDALSLTETSPQNKRPRRPHRALVLSPGRA